MHLQQSAIAPRQHALCLSETWMPLSALSGPRRGRLRRSDGCRRPRLGQEGSWHNEALTPARGANYPSEGVTTQVMEGGNPMLALLRASAIREGLTAEQAAQNRCSMAVLG